MSKLFFFSLFQKSTFISRWNFRCVLKKATNFWLVYEYWRVRKQKKMRESSNNLFNFKQIGSSKREGGEKEGKNAKKEKNPWSVTKRWRMMKNIHKGWAVIQQCSPLKEQNGKGWNRFFHGSSDARDFYDDASYERGRIERQAWKRTR